MAAADVVAVLTDLAARGVQLTVEGDLIRYCPMTVVPPSLTERLRDNKAEVLRLLQLPGANGFNLRELAILARANIAPADVPEVAQAKAAFTGMNMRLVAFEAKPAPIAVTDLPEPWREMFEERAGIMEFDGNLSRERAEELALADILALMDGSGRKLRSEVA